MDVAEAFSVSYELKDFQAQELEESRIGDKGRIVLNNVIPFRSVQCATRPLSIKGLSKDEKEALEQFLQVLRKCCETKRSALRLSVLAYFNSLPGGIWAKKESEGHGG